MIVERVAVIAFGPLKAEDVELAPGMNVVFGPNEAAKSTLHAALFAGLCGMRRSRGQPRREDAEFAGQHRPWSGDRWRVRITLQLADGRRVEVDQDLAELAQCRVRDLTTGRDITSEIVFEGTPDASRWLGLTRRSFLSTACVRQAQLMAVADSPGALQEELQRAAATAGRDETAAAAITRLRGFHSDRVGLDRANSTKPLRTAREALRRRTDELEAARNQHSRVLSLFEAADQKEQEARELAKDVGAAEAALGERAAHAAEQTLARIAELADQYGSEPELLVVDQARADRIAAALANWKSAPAEPDLSGPSAKELEDQVATLPEVPPGDLEVHHTVRKAASEVTVARRAIELQGDPPDEAPEDNVEADDAELQRLAATLAEEAPPADDTRLVARLDTAQRRYEQTSRGPRRLPLILAGLLAAAGAVLLFVSALAGALLLAVGAIVAAYAVASARGGADKLTALEELRAAESELGDARATTDAFRRRREEAEARCRALGVVAQPASIGALLEQRAEARLAVERRGDWLEKRRQLESGVADAETALRDSLTERRAEANGDLDAVLAGYEKACGTRAALASEAGRRPELEASLEARRAAEEANRLRAEAAGAVLQVAAEVGGDTTDPDDAAEQLRRWQSERDADLRARQEAVEGWRELQTLLQDETFDEVAARTRDLRERADALAATVGATRFESALTIQDLDTELADRRADAQAAAEDAAERRAEARTAAESCPSVAEAEEAFAAAEHELGRVEALDETLKTTLTYLERAQERVHRDIAPVLARSISEWLPRVTGERYQEATVDPQDLAVRVRITGGEPHEAAHLSHGTREQIYLLLRLALTEHLVPAPERAPLLFDEVTAHSDANRREVILALLHEISRERQVIVFTHEEPVRLWASENLQSDRDRLFLREPVPVV